MSFLMGKKSYRRGDPFDPADHPWKEVEVQEKKGRIVAVTAAEALPADPPPKPIEALTPRQQEAIVMQEEAKPIRRPGRPKK